MGMKWQNIRIPADLHERLLGLAVEMDHAEQQGWRQKRPSDGVDREQTPIWWVLERAVTEFEQHRKRSRSPRGKASGVPAAANSELPRNAEKTVKRN
jgi:hypothetical protein